MKQNKKARAERRARVLNRPETKLKLVSLLLTELETAAGQMLQEELTFSQAQVQGFLERLRKEFIQVGGNGNQDLRLVAQAFGLAGVKVLLEQYGFTNQQADWWLRQLVERGKKNREALTPNPSPKGRGE